MKRVCITHVIFTSLFLFVNFWGASIELNDNEQIGGFVTYQQPRGVVMLPFFDKNRGTIVSNKLNGRRVSSN